MGRLRHLALFVAFVLTTAGLSFVGPVTADASVTTVTVDQSSLAPGGFWGSPAGSDTGTAGFVSGPASPPAGTGSLALTVPAGQHRSVYDYQFGTCANWPVGYPNCTAPTGTPISSITALSYSTYRDGANSAPNALPSLNIEIDPNPTGPAPHYTTLVWEQSNNGGSTVDNTWETWDAYNSGNGVFWSSQVIPGFPSPGAGGTLLTWNALKAANPTAAIRYGLGVNMGSGPAFTGNVDKPTVGISGNDTNFDFEPSVTNTVVGSGDTSLFPTPTTPWVSSDDSTYAAGDINYVTGPGTPPKGVGSVRLGVTGSGASDLVALNLANSATHFSQISDLHYSTYRSSVDPSGNNLAVALQFNVDYDKTDTTGTWQGRLVFEPYEGIGGNVPQNTWQTWSPTTAGRWWMTGNPIVGNSPVVKQCLQLTPCTWAQVLGFYPNAGFNGGQVSPAIAAQPFINFKAGSAASWPGFVGNVDDFRMSIDGSEANVDFEPNCTTDCYVATTGSDANTGTASDPFLTVQKAIDTVNASGTVHVANGTYNTAVNTTIPKAVTIQGQSRAGTILNGPRAQIDPSGSLAGLQITGTTSNVTIEQLTIQHYDYGIFTNGNLMSNVTIQNLNASDNRLHGIWIQANVGSGINGLTVDNVDASRNNQLGGSAGRGLYVINGPKSNVTVTNSTFDANGLVGLDLSDGSVTGATIMGNTVTNNGDSGIGVLGAIAGGANIVAGNTVTNNGRYGVEIKNSTGDSTDTGTGSVTVSGNTVTRTIAATDARDYGGIVVIRRSPALPINPNQPAGIVIEGNTVNGFHRKASGSTGDGFGIVVGGLSHVISSNIVSNNDVGIQVQGANPSLNAQSTTFFDRDDAANGSATVSRNSITGNTTTGLRIAGNGTATGTCNWWGSASGPGAPGGGGSGDGVSTGVPVTPWLLTSNLNAICPGTVPTVSVGSASMAEGSGTDPVVNLPVTLSSAYGGTVTVNYATADGSGPTGAVAPNDYTSASGTVTFLAGETSKTVPLTIRGNLSPTQFDEKDETFTVALSSPTNATIGTSPGTVTILNDDTPTVSVAAGTISTVEGNSGSHVVQVPVSLTNPSAFPITVAYTTANGGAVAPGDYATSAGTLTIPAGQTSANISVTINGDVLDEPNENLSVTISSPGGGGSVPPILGNASRTIQITNDDTPTISVSNTVIDTVEGNTGTHPVLVTVSLSNPSVTAITVGASTTPGSAVSPSDFVTSSGTVTIPAGQTTGTFTATVKGDTVLEDYEFFNVVLAGPGGGATATPILGNATEKIQILNDEKPSLTGTAPTGSEGSTFQFGATLVQRYYMPISVLYTTANGTATAPGDYATTSGSITFAAGTNGTQTVAVPTNFDFLTELAEKFTMTWSSGLIKVSPVVKSGTIKANHT